MTYSINISRITDLGHVDVSFPEMTAWTNERRVWLCMQRGCFCKCHIPFRLCVDSCVTQAPHLNARSLNPALHDSKCLCQQSLHLCHKMKEVGRRWREKDERRGEEREWEERVKKTCCWYLGPRRYENQTEEEYRLAYEIWNKFKRVSVLGNIER